MKKYILTFIATLFITFFYSQSKITGKVIDEEFNETMPFANVLIKGTSTGVTTDFDGNYTINVDPGSYTLVFSFVGYRTKEITDIMVGENDVKEINVNLSSSSVGLEEVVISVSVQKNTDEALLMMQKKSANLMDGLSSESFKKVGSSNLAGAIKRAPGVSLMGGKYVYVRGLGDRYTKTVLNGIDIPGLDPDRNTIQMDLFPTNVLDNVQIIKSFTADVPADFTGGLVNIVTKEFPSKRSPTISFKLGYNPDMHLIDNFLTYEGSSTDFLGFDNGKRDIPLKYTMNDYYNTEIFKIADIDQEINPSNQTEVGNLTRLFNPTMKASRTNSLMNYSFGYSSGNQFDIGKREHTIGLLGSFSYSNNTTFFNNAQNNYFTKDTDLDNLKLLNFSSQNGDIGINNIIISGLGGLSYRTDYSKYKLTLLHIHNGESKAGYFEQLSLTDVGVPRLKDNLEYTQREITNLLIQGSHTSKKDASFKTEWKISPTISKIHDKDIRSTTFRIEDGNSNNPYYIIDPNVPANRIWRYLNENHLNSKLDFTKNYEMFGEKAKLKFGGLASSQKRDFIIAQFDITNNALANQDSTFNQFEFWTNINSNSDSILTNNNIISSNNNNGTHLDIDNTVITQNNKFNSSKTTFAAYISNELKIFSVLRTIIGLRVEKFDLYYTGNDQGRQLYMSNENIINKLDLFPTINIIYPVNENSNLRTSVTRTTARPSFKEASIAAIYDPLSDRTFNGNIDLKPTYIKNYDLRYEFFGSNSQMFAISSFYKQFKDPIEMTFDEASANNFTPQNLGIAHVIGMEIEIRKNLNFISSQLNNFNVNLNASIIESRLSYGVDEKNNRELKKRTGETIGDYRTLQGQAPFLINSGINYSNPDKGIQTGVFYNVQGKTLEVVGGGEYADVFTMPFHSLNFNLNKTFGKERRSTLNIRVNNILNDQRESRFDSYGLSENDIYYFRLRDLGRVISVGYKYRL